MPLSADELTPGRCFETSGRTISESDISHFADLVGDFTPVHLDESLARAQGWPSRIAHGTLSLAVAIGLFTQVGVLGDNVVGALSTEWRFLAPVAIGDTIRATVIVESARRTSQPDRCVVVFVFDVINQDAGAVLSGRLTVMMRAPEHG